VAAELARHDPTVRVDEEVAGQAERSTAGNVTSTARTIVGQALG